MYKKRIFCVFLIFLWCSSSISFADHGKGPLMVSNQFPPHLMFLTPVSDSPCMLQQGQSNISLAVDYSSVFINEVSNNWSALIDMEMAVIGFRLVYGVTDRFNLSLDLPFVSMNNGFLDGILESYHDTFGFANYGRESRQKNEFAYLLKKNGKDWFKAKSGGFHIADFWLSAKVPVIDEDRYNYLSASIVYRLKVPGGDYEQGFGSGRFDHGFFFLSQIRRSRFTFYLNPGFMLLSDPKTIWADVSVNNVFGLTVCGEYALKESLSLLTQLNYYTSPLEETGIRQLDDDSLEIAIGLNWHFSPKGKLELSFCEDLTRSAPDFNVHAKITWNLSLL